MVANLQMIGNAALLDLPDKVAFLSSRRISAADVRKFYYLGLQEWRQGSRLRLLDTCRAAQDIFIAGLRKFGHTKIAEKALAEQAKSEREMKEVLSE